MGHHFADMVIMKKGRAGDELFESITADEGLDPAVTEVIEKLWDIATTNAEQNLTGKLSPLNRRFKRR